MYIIRGPPISRVAAFPQGPEICSNIDGVCDQNQRAGFDRKHHQYWSRSRGLGGTQPLCLLAVHGLCTSVYLPFYVPSFKFSSSIRSTSRCSSGSRLLCSPILERGSSSTFHGLKLRAASSSRRSTIDLNFGRRSSRSLEQPLVRISSSGRPQRRWKRSARSKLESP